MTNEATVQSLVRLEAARRGWKLWRNNVGTLLDARGVPVRFGLANDSRVVNHVIKSGDLIGVRPVTITADMVGAVIGQFVSIECKRPGWKFNPNDQHERAQMNWAELVMVAGGHATFSTGTLE
jgi:hypothetical protein